ncbi:hypothetical protein [Mucilaginibacter sp. HD30]
MTELHKIVYSPVSKELERCNLIIKECAITLDSLLSIHNEIENEQEKEDLLRAMFVFTTGGLDSIIKQAIKDALPWLIDINKGAENMFLGFVEKDIQR